MGQHWYGPDAKLHTHVPRADGKGLRDATLRDAKKHGWGYSVSRVNKCAAAPQLERWKIRQAIMAALTLTRNVGEEDDAFLERIFEDSGKQAEAARDVGVAGHAALDNYLKGKPYDGQFRPHIEAVIEAMTELGLSTDAANAEVRFYCRHGYGGTIDYREPQIAYVDYKFKDFDDPKKIFLPDENAMQLAAYREGDDGNPSAKLVNIYVSTRVPGLVHVHTWDTERDYLGMFLSLLEYLKLSDGYEPPEPEESL